MFSFFRMTFGKLKKNVPPLPQVSSLLRVYQLTEAAL